MVRQLLKHTFLFSAVALVSQGSWAVTNTASSGISGWIEKDYEADTMNFDVTVKTGSTSFRLVGPVSNRGALGGSDLDFSNVHVRKYFEGCRGRESSMVKIPNQGAFKHLPYLRAFQHSVLAGVPVEGVLVKNLVTGGVSLDNLHVDGLQASGSLEGNWFNWNEYFIRQPLKFGSSVIRATKPHYLAVNSEAGVQASTMRLMLAVDNVKWDGQVVSQHFTNTVNFPSGASTGGPSPVKVKTSSLNRLSGRLSRLDGSSLGVSCSSEILTQDEISVRHLLAFIELLSYDILTER